MSVLPSFPFLYSFIYSQLGVKENKTSFFSLATVMSIWSNGLSALWETVYSTIGDISLHAVILILSTTLFTLLRSDDASSAASSSLSAAVAVDSSSSEL